MASCSEIGPLLGAFEDGELEPHEMQEVARHLAACMTCESQLADYSAIGRELRWQATTPPLEDFTQNVLTKLESLPVPFRMRVARNLGMLSQRMAVGFSLGASALALAAVTALILTPYARQWVGHRSLTQVAYNSASAQPSAKSGLEAKVSNHGVRPAMVAAARKGAEQSAYSAPGTSLVMDVRGHAEPQPGFAAQSQGTDVPSGFMAPEANSRTVISRLEADSPSVAVWSEPTGNTTVIWIPDHK